MMPPAARWMSARIFALTLLLVGLLAWPMGAWASLDNDRYDGNIFALYAGNGSLVPPRITLAERAKILPS